jgi:hypothetical protein
MTESKNIFTAIPGKLLWDLSHGNKARYSGWGVDGVFENLNKH